MSDLSTTQWIVMMLLIVLAVGFGGKAGEAFYGWLKRRWMKRRR